MQYANGGTVQDLIRASRKDPTLLDEEKCRVLLKNILMGIQHIHKTMEMVHRDLKPSNIVIDDPNDLSSVRIADFGLAVKLKDRSELLSTCGTLIYQSPEQIFGTTKQGRSVDIFAIGFILYEVLTGGKHPILLKGEDKQAYRQKMKGFTGLNLEGHGLSTLA